MRYLTNLQKKWRGIKFNINFNLRLKKGGCQLLYAREIKARAVGDFY